MEKKTCVAGSAIPEEEARKQDIEYKTRLECVGFYGLALKNTSKG